MVNEKMRILYAEGLDENDRKVGQYDVWVEEQILTDEAYGTIYKRVNFNNITNDLDAAITNLIRLVQQSYSNYNPEEAALEFFLERKLGHSGARLYKFDSKTSRGVKDKTVTNFETKYYLDYDKNILGPIFQSILEHYWAYTEKIGLGGGDKEEEEEKTGFGGDKDGKSDVNGDDGKSKSGTIDDNGTQPLLSTPPETGPPEEYACGGNGKGDTKKEQSFYKDSINHMLGLDGDQRDDDTNININRWMSNYFL